MNHVCLVQCTVLCSNTKAELATFEFRKVWNDIPKRSPLPRRAGGNIYLPHFCTLQEEFAGLLNS